MNEAARVKSGTSEAPFLAASCWQIVQTIYLNISKNKICVSGLLMGGSANVLWLFIGTNCSVCSRKNNSPTQALKT